MSLPDFKASDLLDILEVRFKKHMYRHPSVDWSNVKRKIEDSSDTLGILYRMEETGGEPDIVTFDSSAKSLLFCDCSSETPKGRRSFCYDREGLESRKEHKPENTAIDLAREIGIRLLSESEYFQLQKIENIDTKTSSWLETPVEIRGLGGALFGAKHYDRVFIYCNGAQSYYSSRGFRGILQI